MGQVVSEPVMLHKSKRVAKPKGGEPGAPVQTVKKFDAGTNKKTVPDTLGRVPAEVRRIQKARLGKKISQADLAKQINQRPQVVPEYENGKTVLNQAVLAKMEKALGVKLRGKISK